MNFKLTKFKKEDEKNYEVSKISGSPVFPKGFISKHKLDGDLFVAQLNLSELKIPELPSKGFLYFFLNVDTFPYLAKVYYNEEEPIEVYDLFNEEFEEFTIPDGYKIVKSNDDTGLSICKEVDPNLDLQAVIDCENSLCLLEIDSMSLPQGLLTLGQPDGWYIFIIGKEDLANRKFSKVQFVSFGS